MAPVSALTVSSERGEALLEALVRAAVDGIVAIDSRGTITAANPAAAQMFGYEATELIGKNVRVLMPEPFRSEHDGYLENYRRTGQPKVIGIGREVVGRRSSGAEFPVQLSVGRACVGEEVHFVGLLRDITSEREAHRARTELIAELEKKNAELERFTYTVSHDLKSPLITIKGFVGLLEQDVREGNVERASHDLRRVAAAADKMKQLLDELLELSRIGRLINPPERVCLSALVQEVRDLLSVPLQSSGVEFVVEGELHAAFGDRLRLREVLQNLVENAIKFMGTQSSPRIAVSSRRTESGIVCSVADNGIGIAPRYLSRIFALFEQLEPGQGGSGVGLTLVRRIVDVHGGRVWATSEGPGAGATFHFELPEPEDHDESTQNHRDR